MGHEGRVGPRHDVGSGRRSGRSIGSGTRVSARGRRPLARSPISAMPDQLSALVRPLAIGSNLVSFWDDRSLVMVASQGLCPSRPLSFPRRPRRGFRIVYELCLAPGEASPPYSAQENHPRASRNEAPVTSATDRLPRRVRIERRGPADRPQPGGDPGLARAGRLRLGSRAPTRWSGPSLAAALFQDIPAETLATGADFAKLLEPSRSIRTDALLNSPPPPVGASVPYRIEYGVRATTSAPVCWIEETGCWFAGPDGKPARVEGIVRVNNERHAREQQLLKLSQHDPLTGELNRTHLIASLAEAIEEASRFRTSLAFMLIGIDHLARDQRCVRLRRRRRGDLRDRASGIRARLRAGDQLGRFSGNKFGVVLKNCTHRRHPRRRRAFPRRRSATTSCRPNPARCRSPPRSARSARRAMPAPPTRRSTAPRRRSTPPSTAAAARFRCGGRMSSATPSAASISASPTRSSPR